MNGIWIIYIACVAGAIGLFLMLPRKGTNYTLLGGIIAAGALGAAMLAVLRFMGTDNTAAAAAASTNSNGNPSVIFYIFAFLAAGGAVRMISHPRPVYAALYFILVVISTAGLFLLLAAEFMAFALIIVYAGAILITYLFVIMLAQQAADEDNKNDELSLYDANAREPLAAVIAGFVLLATLLSIMYRGSEQLPLYNEFTANTSELASYDDLTKKVERTLLSAELITEDESVSKFDADKLVATIASSSTHETRIINVPPDSFKVENIERVGLSLLGEFPVSLEVAGIVLMMSMLGAVVLSRTRAFGIEEEEDNIKAAASAKAAKV